ADVPALLLQRRRQPVPDDQAAEVVLPRHVPAVGRRDTPPLDHAAVALHERVEVLARGSEPVAGQAVDDAGRLLAGEVRQPDAPGWSNEPRWLPQRDHTLSVGTFRSLFRKGSPRPGSGADPVTPV